MIFSYRYYYKNYFGKNNFLFYDCIKVIMVLYSTSFMSENWTSNNIENNEFNKSTEESDYKKLIDRLKEIKTTIALLEKIIFK